MNEAGEDGGGSLASVFSAANKQRQQLDRLPSSSSQDYQDVLRSAISGFSTAAATADRISLFSANEGLEDIATKDIRFLLITFYLGDLSARQTQVDGSRKAALTQARTWYITFLKQLDAYGLLTPTDVDLLEACKEAPDSFSVAASLDAATRREVKIKRFQEEKALKQSLAALQANPSITQDDELARKLYLQEVELAARQSFQALESIAQEMHILSLAPPPQAQGPSPGSNDARERARPGDGYSERLDGPLSSGLAGPLLDSKGRPLRPFTLLDKRQQLRDGVFRPDHSLPTMSIDEYLEEERRRGGIIEGGGPSSGLRPEPDEDDYDKADAETMKARQWDEFTEENPRGSGNTLNMG